MHGGGMDQHMIHPRAACLASFGIPAGGKRLVPRPPPMTIGLRESFMPPRGPVASPARHTRGG